jgi:hypothetical protein
MLVAATLDVTFTALPRVMVVPLYVIPSAPPKVKSPSPSINQPEAPEVESYVEDLIIDVAPPKMISAAPIVPAVILLALISPTSIESIRVC